MRVWWSSRLEKLAVGTAVAALVVYNAYAHSWQAASWPEPNWWFYGILAVGGYLYFLEKLWPIFCWLLWNGAGSTRRIAIVHVLTPALLIGGCLLLGRLAPPDYRHWMDVALVILLLLAPCWLALTASRLRERIPQALFGWNKTELDSWTKA